MPSFMPSIKFNIPAMISQNKLRMHNNALTTATERLATGTRINSAKDDPFRNSEAHNLNSEVRVGEKAKSNASEGAAMLQIAEGTCGEVQSILQRLKELSVQSANDTLTSTERHYINIEATELTKEITRIAGGSTYNSKQLFGNPDSGGEGGDLFSNDNRKIDEWKPFTQDKNGRYGVLHIGTGTADRTDEVKVSLPELSAKFLGLKSDDPNGYNLDLSTYEGATAAINNLDTAISTLGTVRSYVGSLVNRMDRQVEDIESKNINLNDAESKIRDADFAQEATNLTLAQVQQQAAISVLAQCNARTSRVLEILG